MGREFDTTGLYYYEPGYCCRDAFAQHFGEHHPIVRELPYAITMTHLRDVCRRWGLEHELSRAGFPERSFPVDAAVVWIFTSSADNQDSHTVYCSPSRILEAQAERGFVICGYVILPGDEDG